MLDEEEFLGPHGIRSVSRWHAEHPYVLKVDGQEYGVGYLPAESDTGMFGGNSNWRGPVWFPINVMLIRALLNLHVFFGDGFHRRVPDRIRAADEPVRGGPRDQRPADRHVPGGPATAAGPVHGGQPILQDDPHWRDLLLFYEYFHGDNGAGIGASHQTGWTGTVALLPLLFRGDAIDGCPMARIAAPGQAGARGTAAQAAQADDGGHAMTGWPDQPVIYEINTAVWLDALSRAAGRPPDPGRRAGVRLGRGHPGPASTRSG